MRTWLALLLGVVGMAACGSWTHAFSTNRGLREVTVQTQSSGWNLENVHSLVRGTFWEFRRSLAILTWNEAQVYFHKGFDLSAFTPRLQEITSETLVDAEGHAHAHEHGHEHGVAEGDEAQLRIHTPEEEARIHSLEDHPFLHRSLLRPYVYEHSDLVAHGERMMPFYWLTTTLDPNFVRAYANGAYWLAMYYKRPQEALAYLDEGMEHNPNDPLLFATRAHVYFSTLRRFDLAARYYERAVAANPSRSQEERDDCIESLRYLARSYLYSGQPRKAIETCLRAKQMEKLAFGFDTVMEEANKALAARGVHASALDDAGTSVPDSGVSPH